MATFEVIVGNVGSVYSGIQLKEALEHYGEYIQQSKTGLGRAGGEEVVLMKDGEPWKEHVPENPQEFVVRFTVRAGYADNFGEAASQLRVALEEALAQELSHIQEHVDADIVLEHVERHTPPCDD